MKFVVIISIFTLFILPLIILSCKSKSKIGSDFIIGERINFQNKNGSFKFTAIPTMGRDYEMMERSFAGFKELNKELKDTIIYRTTKKNYFKISKWKQYKKLPEWRYPYLPVRKR